jgi:hypothetical protein
VLGPVQGAARTSASALAGHLDPALVTKLPVAERNTLWILLVIAAANVALGVWRPRMPQMPLF